MENFQIVLTGRFKNVINLLQMPANMLRNNKSEKILRVETAAVNLQEQMATLLTVF